MSKAAKELADEVNSKLEEIKNTPTRRLTKTPEEIKAANARAQKRRIARRRNGDPERVYCKGTNLAGNPCRQAPLLKENWDGEEEITGFYCLWHEPNISRDQRESYKLFGSSKHPVFRKVTPGEMAHELILRSPQHFLRPYLKALGLRLSEDGEVEKIGTGLKLYGYSRGGQVIQSPYPDLVAQQHTVERLIDRVWGRPRASIDLASQNTSVSVSIVMDEDRVSKVASVLSAAGLLGNGNGNGNGHVIDTTAVDLDQENDPSV